MLIFKLFWWLVHLVFIVFLLFHPIIVLAFLLLKKRQVAKNEVKTTDKNAHFACVITAYKQLDICWPLVDSLMQQQYEHYTIYLVADDCEDTADDLPYNEEMTNDLLILRPTEKLGSKLKSIQYAMANFKQKHEALIIFDPDNLAIPDFLTIANQYFQAGYKAVQGQRTAKNLETIYACADSISELYANYTGRFVPFQLGGSSAVAGSAMLIDTELYQAYLDSEAVAEDLKTDKVIVAEDNILQNFLVAQNYRIAFAQKAIVFDEKVSTAKQVERQRARWIFSYFQHAQTAAEMLWQGVKNRSWNQFLFGGTTLFPPFFILVLGSVALAGIDVLFGATFFAGYLLLAVLAFIINFFAVLYLAKAPKIIWQSLWGLPFFVLNQILALLQIRKLNTDFMITEKKHHISIEDAQQKNDKKL